MNEQQVNTLLAALKEQIAGQKAQTEAINRLAESNMALCDVFIQSLGADEEVDVEPQTYLSGKPVRQG